MSKKPAKKLIIASLVLALVASVFVLFTACGEETEEAVYDYFSFSYNSELSGLVLDSVDVNNLPAAVTIPAGYYADGASRDTKFAVVKIADGAFANCTKITSVTLPDTLTIIGDSAFKGCAGLTSINLDNVKSLGGDAFRNSKKLAAVTFSSDGLTAIPDGAFSGCLALDSVSGTSKIKSIGNSSFGTCNNLRTFSLDLSALESIGARAFFYMGLTSFDIPSSCKSVGAGAFEGWTKYQTVTYTTEFAEGWKDGAPAEVFVKA